MAGAAYVELLERVDEAEPVAFGRGADTLGLLRRTYELLA